MKKDFDERAMRVTLDLLRRLLLRIPRGMPNRYSVNIRCLEGVDVESIPTEHFDGRNKLKV